MTNLMTVEETADYLRVTKKTIYRLLEKNHIPATKVGHQWRLDKGAIDKWLCQNMEGTKARILVIDDDQLILALLKEILEKQGHTVITADTSTEGVRCVKQLDFDLVFLDLKMPVMDGAEVLRQMRSIKPDLPVTIITGYPDSEILQRALEQGPFGVMTKPFGHSDIIAAVHSFLRTIQTRG